MKTFLLIFAINLLIINNILASAQVNAERFLPVSGKKTLALLPKTLHTVRLAVQPFDEDDPKPTAVEPLSAASMLAVVAGSLMFLMGGWQAALLLGFPALLLGVVGLFRIKKHKEKFGCRCLAIAGIVMGAGMLLLLAYLTSLGILTTLIVGKSL